MRYTKSVVARSSPVRTTAQPRRRDEAKALFRNAILDAAEEVFAERGFHVARIHDVADRARMAVGTIYNHFGQKEDVLRALIEERTADMLRSFSPSVADPAHFEDRLAARLERLLAYVAAHKNFYSLAIEHGLLGGATASARQMQGKKSIANIARFKAGMRRLVCEGVSEGVLAPHDPDLLVRFLGSALRATTLQLIEGKGSPADARTIAALFVHGAGAKRSPRPRR
jgi:AcrR family transcriptional regulator